MSLGVCRVKDGEVGEGALPLWSPWPHQLLCPIAPGAVPVPGAQAAERSSVSVPITAQPLAATSWAPIAQQLLQRSPQAMPLVTAKPEPAAGQLCVAKPGKPRQRGAGTALSSPAPSLPRSPCSSQICWTRTAS